MSSRETTGAYRIRRSIRNLDLILEHAGLRLEGKSVLEIGTGWRGADLVLWHLAGARRIFTFDHVRWLSEEGVLHSIDLVADQFPEIQPSLEAHAGGTAVRLEALVDAARSAPGLDGLLDHMNVEYTVVPLGDPRRVGTPVGQVDLFYTESVLQRLPERALQDVVRHVATELLASGGAFLHRTDQRDIHSLPHTETDRWALKYLEYGDWWFRRVMSGRYTSQNRLRESDFEALFRSAGLHPRYVESRILAGDLDRAARLRPATRFRGRTLDDLATRASIFVGTQGAAGPGAGHHEPVRLRRVLDSVEEIES